MRHPLNAEKVKIVLKEVTRWASHRTDIAAMALVGSWAREAARVDSDIDLMFLTDSPSLFRLDKKWIDEIQWAIIGGEIDDWQDQDYGVVWSRHVYLDDGTEIEFSFGSPSWASVDLIDPGTFRVVSDGCQILYDPKDLLGKLIDKIRSTQKL
jgi:uncharacterized protein